MPWHQNSGNDNASLLKSLVFASIQFPPFLFQGLQHLLRYGSIGVCHLPELTKVQQRD